MNAISNLSLRTLHFTPISALKFPHFYSAFYPLTTPHPHTPHCVIRKSDVVCRIDAATEQEDVELVNCELIGGATIVFYIDLLNKI